MPKKGITLKKENVNNCEDPGNPDIGGCSSETSTSSSILGCCEVIVLEACCRQVGYLRPLAGNLRLAVLSGRDGAMLPPPVPL